MNPPLPYSQIVRVNEIGGGLERVLDPDEAARSAIARALDLAALDAFHAELLLRPAAEIEGWRLTGRLVAEAVQTCGVTLEPLPVKVDERFSIDLIESPDWPSEEIEITLEDDAPDVIEDGRIDLGQYAVEQLALQLDPFPRKPGAEFVQPEQPAEASPFAVLRTLRPSNDTSE